tara:strand:- start:1385 stop:1861 length:477 start_codon:yes stop_codon:yes gene_type:complete
MKKIIFLLIFLSIGACSGYKPIFSSSNINFTLNNYSISGDKKIGNQIYSKLYKISKSSKNSPDTKNISIIINSQKDKNPTSKDKTGKVLAYKINILADITVKDLETNNEILSEKFNSSLSYKVQNQHSETIKLENKSIENIVDRIYQDFIIKLSESFL